MPAAAAAGIGSGHNSAPSSAAAHAPAPPEGPLPSAEALLPPWTAPGASGLLPEYVPDPLALARAGAADGPAQQLCLLRALQVVEALRGRALTAPDAARLLPLPHQLAVCATVVHGFGRGALLADEVGLGKTIEAGLILTELMARGEVRRALVLTPSSLRGQWEEELRHRFGLQPWVYGRDGIGPALTSAPQGVVLASLDTAKAPRHLRHFGAVAWDLVIVDEAHRLRSARTRAHQLVSALGPPWLLLLTATPVQNSLREIHTLVGLIDPLVLGTEERFCALFMADGKGRKVARPEELRRRLRTVMVRHRRAQLPDLHDHGRSARTVRVRLSPKERRLYDELCEELRGRYRRAAEQGRPAYGFLLTLYQRMLASSFTTLAQSLRARVAHLDRLLGAASTRASPAGTRCHRSPDAVSDGDDTGQLWPVWDGPSADLGDAGAGAGGDRWLQALLAEDRAAAVDELRQERDRVASLLQRLAALPTPTKVRRVAGLVRELASRSPDDGGGQLVLFTEFLATQEEVVASLRAQGHQVVVFNGGLRPQDKDRALARFRAGAAVLVSTEAGAEGLNLQSCSTIVNLDLPWNPMRVEQRIGRLHRLGQTRTVRVVNLVSAGTVEEAVLELLAEKIGLFEAVMGDLELILGEVTADRPLERVVMDELSAAAAPQGDRSRLASLGARITDARRAYDEARALTDSTLGPLALQPEDHPSSGGSQVGQALRRWLTAWGAAHGLAVIVERDSAMVPPHPAAGAMAGRWRLLPRGGQGRDAPGGPADLSAAGTDPLLWPTHPAVGQALQRSLRCGATAVARVRPGHPRFEGRAGLQGLVLTAAVRSPVVGDPVLIHVWLAASGAPLPPDLPPLEELLAEVGSAEAAPLPPLDPALVALAMGRAQRQAEGAHSVAAAGTGGPGPAPGAGDRDRWLRLRRTLLDHYADLQQPLAQQEARLRGASGRAIVGQRSATGRRRREAVHRHSVAAQGLAAVQGQRALLAAQQAWVLQELQARELAAARRGTVTVTPVALTWVEVDPQALVRSRSRAPTARS